MNGSTASSASSSVSVRASRRTWSSMPSRREVAVVDLGEQQFAAGAGRRVARPAASIIATSRTSSTPETSLTEKPARRAHSTASSWPMTRSSTNRSPAGGREHDTPPVVGDPDGAHPVVAHVGELLQVHPGVGVLGELGEGLDGPLADGRLELRELGQELDSDGQLRHERSFPPVRTGWSMPARADRSRAGCIHGLHVGASRRTVSEPRLGGTESFRRRTRRSRGPVRRVRRHTPARWRELSTFRLCGRTRRARSLAPSTAEGR